MTVQVQVFSDVTCPECYVAVTRLQRAAGMFVLRTGEPVELALRAFQRHPGTREPRPLLDALAEELGAHEAELAAAELSEAFAVEGLPLDLPAAVRADTFDAHRLLTWAESVGGEPAQLALAAELWRAHLAEGADVSDPTTLATRAAVVGLDLAAAERVLDSDTAAAEVALQLDTARSLAITTLPTVVLERTYLIAGVQSQATYERLLTEVRAYASGAERDPGDAQ